MMRPRRAMLFSMVLLVASLAAADSRIVQHTHQDAFTVMGQSHPARDQEQVMWVGADRLRLDHGDTSTVVRLDQGKMFFIDHKGKTVSTLDLPADLAALMPAGMGEQMLKMMQFEVEVTPGDETRTISGWKARSWKVDMKSPMMTVSGTYWATRDVSIDNDNFYQLYQRVLSLQPGMAEVAEKLRKIDGFVVAQESVARMPMMGDAEMKTSQEVVSIEEQAPPAGTYEPPADYTAKPFDFLAAMQRRQQE